MSATWQFVLAYPHGGDPYLDLQSCTGRTINMKLDEASQASFTMNGHSPEVLQIRDLATDLIVLRDGMKIFRGRIAPTQDTLDATSHKCTFTAIDYRGLLDRRYIMEGDRTIYTEWEQEAMVWELISVTQAKTNGNLGITRSNILGSGISRDFAFEMGAKIGDEIQKLGDAVNGFDWEIDADLVLRIYFPLRGRVGDYYMDWGGAITSMNRAVDPTQFANVVRMQGGQLVTDGPNLTSIAFSSDLDHDPAGRWEDVHSDGDLKSQALVEDRAVWYTQNEVNIQPSYTVKLATDKWTGPEQLWLGDAPRLVISSGRLQVDNSNLRISEMNITIDDNGNEEVQPTLGYRPRNIFERSHHYADRLSTLERR
jgi:hypothetical protein